MPTKAEVKAAATHIKLKVRKGDRVMIISGRDKGQVGFIAGVSPANQKAYVLKENEENPDQPLPLNAVIKHRKARQQNERSARVKIPAPIHLSNLMVLDPTSNQPTRIGRRKDDISGKLVRYSKKTGALIPDAEVMTKA